MMLLIAIDAVDSIIIEKTIIIIDTTNRIKNNNKILVLIKHIIPKKWNNKFSIERYILHIRHRREENLFHRTHLAEVGYRENNKLMA